MTREKLGALPRAKNIHRSCATNRNQEAAKYRTAETKKHSSSVDEMSRLLSPARVLLLCRFFLLLDEIRNIKFRVSRHIELLGEAHGVRFTDFAERGRL
jgi:hypothetical protein